MLKSRLRRLGLAGLGLLGWLVPHDRKLVIFSQARDAYSDNSRALFEHLVAEGYRVRWLYHLERPESEAVERRFFVRRKSFYGIWIAFRARVAVISHGLYDLGPWVSLCSRKRVLMLWHGIGLKKLGVLEPLEDSNAIRSRTRCYDAMIATSDMTRYYTAAHDAVPVEKVHVTGLPRSDRLFFKRYNAPLNCDRRVSVLYAPTFRDFDRGEESIFFPFDDFCAESMAKIFNEQAIQLQLRPHPRDVASVEHARSLASRYPDVFVNATVEKIPDPTDILAEVDAVITDYSSIYLDVVPFDVPCIFIPFDLRRYEETRGIAYDYEAVTPGPHVSTQLGFIDAVIDAKAGAPAWAGQRQFVSAMFHRYVDGKACERTARVVENLTSN